MEPLSTPPPADPIADALRSLSVRSSIFCRSEMGAPWAFRVDGAPMSKFHLVLSGSGWLTLDVHDPVLLQTGDLVVLPRGQAHTMGDTPGTPATTLDRLIEEHPLEEGARLRCGGPGPVTRLLCGGFSLADEAAVLTLVPDILRVDARSVATSTWLVPMLISLQTDIGTSDRGASAVEAKIADVFLTQALRSWLDAADRAGVLPAALLSEDELIAAAMSMVRGSLSTRWTIDKLASNVGLSRTAFISRFRRAVDESPMHYVARLRLSTAAGLLSTTRLSLQEVAFATGYQNDSSLSKAFSRQFGTAPGVFRATHRASPAAGDG